MTDLERQIRSGAFAREDAEGVVMSHTVDVLKTDFPAVTTALRENLWHVDWSYTGKDLPGGHYRVTFWSDFIEHEPELPLSPPS